MSIDFNHRPALGPLEVLWQLVHGVVQSGAIRILIFSLKTLRQVAELLGLEVGLATIGIADMAAEPLSMYEAPDSEELRLLWALILCVWRALLVSSSRLPSPGIGPGRLAQAACFSSHFQTCRAAHLRMFAAFTGLGVVYGRHRANLRLKRRAV